MPRVAAYVKKPRVGATLKTMRYGPVIVQAVHNGGIALDVTDTHRHTHRITRVPVAYWGVIHPIG